ncbi:MAG TPA: hypothetical protein VG899_15375 [Mycobacteriales bacterium]|nr:hypothetical protein [Mycobacteriales bacterium]
MSRRRATLLALGATMSVSWLLVGAAASAFPVTDTGQPASKTVMVADSAEGWYAPSIINLCALPVGCPPALPLSLYPANTLHVGVLLGQQTAQTYLEPDLGSLPAGADVRRATMTLPLASGATAGNESPASATAEACLVTSAFADGAAGTPATLPAVNCANAAKLHYDAAKNDFTVDLTPFVAAWAKGEPEDGIAILAGPGKIALTAAWSVAFDGRKLAGAPHISTSIEFAPGPDESGPAGSPSASPSPTATAAAPPQLTLPPGDSTVPVQPAAPDIAAPATTATTPVAFSRGFKYPMAFLFPIALLAVAVFLTRLFTSDATPMRHG